jgi:hypothetical protein
MGRRNPTRIIFSRTAVIAALLMAAACQSSPTLVTDTDSSAPRGIAPAPGSPGPPASGPVGRSARIDVGSEPAGWGVLNVEARALRTLIGFQDQQLEAGRRSVFLVVTVGLRKLHPGPQALPTEGVVLHGDGRVRRPDGFGEDGRYCLHCRFRNRTTSRIVHLGFVFEIPRAEVGRRHALLFP